MGRNLEFPAQKSKLGGLKESRWKLLEGCKPNEGEVCRRALVAA